MILPSPSPLLIGLDGARPTAEAVRLLRDTGAAGVLLLARNIGSPARTRDLVRGLQDRLGRPLLFTVDHEGGWVLRFARGLTAFPGNAALGRARDPRWARATGRRMGLELRSLGIGLNLAPVLDVAGPRYNPGLGIRSFGEDPLLAARLGRAFICGLNDHNVGACAKHFPGKGEARVDAHISQPTIPVSRARLRRLHLPPFQAAIRAGADCVMTSHALYPALDPRQPATFSSRIARDLLRGRMGFRGVTISDDLCMGAVAGRRPVPQAAVDSFAAGHDLLIVAHAPSLQREAAEALARALDDGRLPPRDWLEARARVERLLARRARPPSGPLRGPDARLAARIASRAVEVLREGAVRLPLARRNGPPPRLAVLWPDLPEVADRFTFEGGPLAPGRRARRRLAAAGRLAWIRTPVLAKGVPAGLRESVSKADVVLLFLFEALRFPGQRRVLDAVQRRAPERLVALLLREPKDAALLKPGVAALTAHGYRDCQIDALLEAIL